MGFTRTHFPAVINPLLNAGLWIEYNSALISQPCVAGGAVPALGSLACLSLTHTGAQRRMYPLLKWKSLRCHCFSCFLAGDKRVPDVALSSGKVSLRFVITGELSLKINWYLQGCKLVSLALWMQSCSHLMAACLCHFLWPCAVIWKRGRQAHSPAVGEGRLLFL